MTLLSFCAGTFMFCFNILVLSFGVTTLTLGLWPLIYPPGLIGFINGIYNTTFVLSVDTKKNLLPKNIQEGFKMHAKRNLLQYKVNKQWEYNHDANFETTTDMNEFTTIETSAYITTDINPYTTTEENKHFVEKAYIHSEAMSDDDFENILGMPNINTDEYFAEFSKIRHSSKATLTKSAYRLSHGSLSKSFRPSSIRSTLSSSHRVPQLKALLHEFHNTSYNNEVDTYPSNKRMNIVRKEPTKNYRNVKALEMDTTYSWIWFYIVSFGILMIATSLQGICAIYSRSPQRYCCYFVFLIMLFAALTYFMIFVARCLFSEDYLLALFDRTFEDNGSLESVIWKIIMLRFGCCGVRGYKDFSSTAWNSTAGNLLFPLSCCKYNLEPPNMCNLRDIDSTNAKIGCFNLLKASSNKHLIPIAFLILSIYGVLIVLPVVALYSIPVYKRKCTCGHSVYSKFRIYDSLVKKERECESIAPSSKPSQVSAAGSKKFGKSFFKFHP